MIRAEGVASLYKGLSPTLFRDVPFSAVYWLCIERLRERWGSPEQQISAWQQAGQALFNGSTAGIIAAACTTPLDVVKTRRQLEIQSVAIESSFCDHQGAIAYQPKTSKAQAQPTRTFEMMRSIIENEGLSGLWRGNQARMIKVAPACAIMLSSYEIGKRLLTE